MRGFSGIILSWIGSDWRLRVEGVNLMESIDERFQDSLREAFERNETEKHIARHFRECDPAP